MAEEQVPESQDGRGSGDHDQPYRFGEARSRLNVWDWMRLLIMRGYVIDGHMLDDRTSEETP